jgi:hypothetical protein
VSEKAEGEGRLKKMKHYHSHKEVAASLLKNCWEIFKRGKNMM